MKGDTELAQMLIYAGANVRATTRLGAYTPLYLAAKGGHSGVVAALLAAGADAKATTSNGTTPLMIAAAAGDTRTITSLVENGADINAKDGAKGETPLMFAAAFNRTDAGLAVSVLYRTESRAVRYGAYTQTCPSITPLLLASAVAVGYHAISLPEA